MQCIVLYVVRMHCARAGICDAVAMPASLKDDAERVECTQRGPVRTQKGAKGEKHGRATVDRFCSAAVRTRQRWAAKGHWQYSVRWGVEATAVSSRASGWRMHSVHEETHERECVHSHHRSPCAGVTRRATVTYIILH